MGQGEGLRGRIAYCSMPRTSPGETDSQIHTHVTLISVSGGWIREIRVMIIKSRKTGKEGLGEV